MTLRGAHARILERVVNWEGVVASSHRFGGTEFRLGRRELGHIHGDQWADIVFPMQVRDHLVAEGRAEPHHILRRSGWITFRLRREGDEEAAIQLFRRSYDIAREALGGVKSIISPVGHRLPARDQAGGCAIDREAATAG
jgi:hypothetical protein